MKRRAVPATFAVNSARFRLEENTHRSATAVSRLDQVIVAPGTTAPAESTSDAVRIRLSPA